MKRVITLFCALFVILIGASSCGSKDKNIDLAKKEFKNYVQKTFDDPRALKEIVEIIPSDTVSVVRMKRLLNNTCELCDLALKTVEIQDSLQSEVFNMDNINNLDKRRARNVDFSTRIKILSVAESMITIVTELAQGKVAVRQNMALLKDCADSLQYEAPIYEYKINYRVERNKELKLESQYAYIDSLKGFIKIMPQTMTEDEYSEQMSHALGVAKKTMIEVDNLNDTANKQMESIKELQSFLFMYSK